MTVLLYSTALNCAAENNAIQVENAWLRAAPPNIKVTAGYMDINNNSDLVYTLKSVTSKSFEYIELHFSHLENGIARMQQQDNIVIAPKTTFKFEPGAYHLMLFNKLEPLHEGQNITLQLEFSNGEIHKLNAIVTLPSSARPPATKIQ